MARILDFADGFESSVAPDSVPVDATQVSVTPDGNLSSTDAQAAFEELQGDIDAINTSKGANNGIATLDSGGKVPSSQLPAIAITEVYVVADITARDALTVDEGDIAKVTDAGGGTTKTYIYDGSSWIEIQADGQLATHEADTSTHGVSTIAGLSETQIFTNKDYDGGTASNTSRLTVPKNTKSNLDSLTRKEATIVYATDEAKAYIDNGSTLIPVGSGSGGGLNYIENGDAELASPAPSLYSDAADVKPADGQGGSVNTSTELDFSRSTSSPLRGSASWVFDKKSGNQQGKGGSFPFTIDVADKGKQVQITFDYSVLSGTYATGDVAVYIVHDPSGTPKVIQPSAFNIENVGIESLARLTFQTEYSSVLDYNLCFHVASTSASAYSLKFDNIKLGPQVVPMGAPVTDAVAKTTSGSWVSNVTYTMRERQVGDFAHYSVRVALTGAPTATVLTVNLPSGRVIDTTKLASGTSNVELPGGDGSLFDNGSYYGAVKAFYNNTTSVELRATSIANPASYEQVTATTPITFAASDSIDFTFSVPIVGWSSSTVVSSSAATRAVAARLTGATNASFLATAGVTWSASATLDTHGMYNGSNLLTCRVPGIYKVGAGILTSSYAMSATGSFQVFYRVNGGSDVRIGWMNGGGATVNYWAGGEDTVRLKAGDTVEFRVSSTNTASLSGGYGTLEMLQGPSQIAASEIVSMVCYKNTGSHTSTGNFQDVASWNAVTQDTHGGFNTTTGVYTCPAPGTYVVRSKVGFTSNATGFRQLQIVRDGSAVSYSPDITGAVSSAVQGYTVIPNCVAGTLIKVQAYQNSGGNLAYSTSANFTELSIHRLGGR